MACAHTPDLSDITSDTEHTGDTQSCSVLARRDMASWANVTRGQQSLEGSLEAAGVQ